MWIIKLNFSTHTHTHLKYFMCVLNSLHFLLCKFFYQPALVVVNFLSFPRERLLITTHARQIFTLFREHQNACASPCGCFSADICSSNEGLSGVHTRCGRSRINCLSCVLPKCELQWNSDSVKRLCRWFRGIQKAVSPHVWSKQRGI